MNFVTSAVLTVLAVSGSASASPDVTPDVQGTANMRFITSAMGAMPQKFAIPIVLFFNKGGCLAWSSFGFDEGWQADLAKAPEGTACAKPTLPATLEQLEADGVAVKAAELGGPVAIWYGSDSMCADCKVKSASGLPELMTQLPKGTKLIKLDWQ